MVNRYRGELTFGGTPLSDFSVYIDGTQTYGGPERDVEFVEVPGRHGSLMYDNNRYKNQEIELDSFIIDRTPDNVERLRDYLESRSGYQRLEVSYHPDEYRMAAFVGPLDVDMLCRHKHAQFTLNFNCKPQRWLKSGEHVITIAESGAVLSNPTYQTARPLIRAYGTGTISIGGTSITITAADEYTDIDSERMTAYKDGTNCNGNITGDFPELAAGENSVVFPSTITKLEIIPRWWRA